MINFRFPNFSHLFSSFGATLQRFPLVNALAILASFICIYLLEHSRGSQIDPVFQFRLVRIVWICGMGISFVFSAALMAERGVLKMNSTLAQAIATLIMVAYYFTLPDKEESYNHFWIIQLLVFAISSHLLASFAPYIGYKTANGFWQYNKTLFINILISMLYTYVLFAGLSLAITAVAKLFDIDFEWNIYLKLLCLLQGIFNTCFFLSKVPKDFDELEESQDYPLGLKLFSQYVLLPLVAIYLAILYAYESKILIKFTLPYGWVTYLVMGFSVLGILCFLLLYPFGKMQENTWIAKFSRWFYILILPLLALLFVAIGYRSSQYGITENRYFILLTGFWLLGIALYFIFSKKDNIAVIPISLSIVTFLSGFGFWGAYSLGLRSQKQQLIGLFEKYQLVANPNEKSKPVSNMTNRDAVRINSAIKYFERRHEIEALLPLFNADDKEKFKDVTFNSALLLSYIGVPQKGDWDINLSNENEMIDAVTQFSLKTFVEDREENQLLAVTGYDYSEYISSYYSDKEAKIYYLNGEKLSIDMYNNQLFFNFKNEKKEVNILDFYEKNIKKFENMDDGNATNVPTQNMTMYVKSNAYDAKLIFTNLGIRSVNDSLSVENVSYRMLIDLK